MVSLKEFLIEALVSKKVAKPDTIENTEKILQTFLSNTPKHAIQGTSAVGYLCPRLSNNAICYLAYNSSEKCFVLIKSQFRKPAFIYKLTGLDNIVGLKDFDPLDLRISAGVNRNDYTLIISAENYWKKPNNQNLYIKAKAKGNTIEIQSCEKK